MSRFTSREDLYNNVPLSLNDNRDEHILIDILGNWIPECDIFYYGLLNSEYSDKLYKLKNTKVFNPRDIYLESCYFSGDDLVKYLASKDDTLVDLDDKYIEDAIRTAFSKYSYVPCNETMLRHSIIELAYFNFIKSITLVYPWDVREIDHLYLSMIIPKTVLPKFKVVSGNIVDFIKSNCGTDTKYTTIISNSIEDVNKLIDNSEKYHTNESFYLLRNHSKNVKHEISEDPENPGKKKISFEEIGTEEILYKLIDSERGIPKTQMRFARYEPVLFDDVKPDPNNFTLGR